MSKIETHSTPWHPGFALGTVFVYLFLLVAANVIINNTPLVSTVSEATRALYISLTASALILGFIYYRIRHTKSSWSSVGFVRFSPQLTLRYIGLYFVVTSCVIIGIIAFVLVFMTIPEDTSNAASNVIAPTWQFTLKSIIVAPIIEEIVFRGILFASFFRHMSFIKAAILSSLLFTAFHPSQTVPIIVFLLSLLLCLFYRKTGSIIPGIILHALHNLTMAAIWLV